MPPPPPPKPTYPTHWIPVGIVGLALSLTGFLFRQSLLTLSPTGVGILGSILILITGYMFLKYYGDYDYYDWYHGPGNSDNRNDRK